MIGIGLIDCKLETSYPTFHSSNKIKDRNKLLKELVNFPYSFIIQKGVKVIDPLTFEHFRITSEKTGHECLLYGRSEPSNQEILYDKDPYVDYWQYPGTMFMMLTRNAVQKAGWLDENFPENTWEDVEYIQRLMNFGITPPFGLFVGIKRENHYLDLDMEILKKRATMTAKFKKTLEAATRYWQSKDPERFPHMGEPKHFDKKIEMKKGGGEMI